VELPFQTKQDLAAAVRSCELPAISGIASRLVATLSDEQVDITYLRDLIAQDPALTVAVLRWANSPLYGAQRKINTLDAAISMLGTAGVRARSVGFFVANTFDPPQGLDRDVFWASCMHSAGYALWLALALGLNESEAWLTALMTRLGELVIGQLDRPTVEALEAKPLPVQQRWQMERERIGFDEGAAMAEVARLWSFPDSMVEALQQCARPLHFSAFSPLGAVVHLAMLLADMETVDQASLQTLPPEVTARLGIALDWMAQHIPERTSFTDFRA
jgi:HD-like signal output (HDOD) protein